MFFNTIQPYPCKFFKDAALEQSTLRCQIYSYKRSMKPDLHLNYFQQLGGSSFQNFDFKVHIPRVPLYLDAEVGLKIGKTWSDYNVGYKLQVALY